MSNLTAYSSESGQFSALPGTQGGLISGFDACFCDYGRGDENRFPSCVKTGAIAKPLMVFFRVRNLDALEPCRHTGSIFWIRKHFDGCNAFKRKGNPTRVLIEEKRAYGGEQFDAFQALWNDPKRCIHMVTAGATSLNWLCAARDTGTHFLLRSCIDRLGGIRPPMKWGFAAFIGRDRSGSAVRWSSRMRIYSGNRFRGAEFTKNWSTCAPASETVGAG